MSWNFDWSVVGEVLTDLIRKVGDLLQIIVDTVKISFP